MTHTSCSKITNEDRSVCTAKTYSSVTTNLNNIIGKCNLIAERTNASNLYIICSKCMSYIYFVVISTCTTQSGYNTCICKQAGNITLRESCICYNQSCSSRYASNIPVSSVCLIINKVASYIKITANIEVASNCTNTSSVEIIYNCPRSNSSLIIKNKDFRCLWFTIV